MRIQCDTLKYAKQLKQKGGEAVVADGLMSTFTEIEIFNIHSKKEVDNMLSKSIERLFDEQDAKLAKQTLKLAEQKREFNARMKEEAKKFAMQMRDTAKHHEQQLNENRHELLASRRWMIGTIITVGLSLAAYLSALIHFNH